MIGFDVFDMRFEGASHAEYVGAVLCGMPKNVAVNVDSITEFMDRRRSGTVFTTPRKEADIPEFLSGIDGGKTTGEPIHVRIANKNVKRSDYCFADTPRPSHADYVALKKYGKDFDMSGGGPFSGRMTAPICALGAIARDFLLARGIKIYSYVASVGEVEGISYKNANFHLESLKKYDIRTIAEGALKDAVASGDSLGGVVECVVTGLPVGLGGELDKGLEVKLASAIYTIPAVKGVEFGRGFAISALHGSDANDAFAFDADNNVVTLTNNAGGLNGGITNGMPLTLAIAFRPTPTISKPQNTVDLAKDKATVLDAKGRHDVCIALRAPVVAESMVALAIMDEIVAEDTIKDKYYLIGKSLPHTFSPEIHHRFGYSYEVKELPTEDTVKEFVLSKNYSGMNVTIPYKETVIPLLDEISPEAQTAGSVNTIVNNCGKLIGYNTDISGMELALRSAGIALKDKVVMILGSGGTGKTAVQVAKDGGAKEIYVISRNGSYNYQNAHELTGVQVIINATPVGMSPAITDVPISLDQYKHLEGVFDVIYNPLRTRLVLVAKDSGVKASGGLIMLTAQAKLARDKFLGESTGLNLAEKVANEIYKARVNILLVGMPGSGKSTIGKLLAKKTGRKFIDTDALIKERFGKEPGEIILSEGELAFREKEAEILAEVARGFGCVIATGGGILTYGINKDLVRTNGFVIYLKRDLNKLCKRGRPLSYGSLEELFEKRKNGYEAVADATIINDNIDLTVREALSEYDKYIGY